MNDQTPSPTDEARALLAAATPGPWFYNDRYGHVWATIDGSKITEWPVPDDAALIAASPRLLAALADRVDELEAWLADTQLAVQEKDAMWTREWVRVELLEAAIRQHIHDMRNHGAQGWTGDLGAVLDTEGGQGENFCPDSSLTAWGERLLDTEGEPT